MPRGGKREGAGSKPTWKHGKTKTIRVPIALAEAVLAFAKELDDKGMIECDTDSKVINLSGISIRQHDGLISVHLEDLVKVGYKIRPEPLSKLVEARLQKLEVDKRLNHGNNPQRRERSRILHS